MSKRSHPDNYPNPASFDYSDWEEVRRRLQSYSNTLEDSQAMTVETANLGKMYREGLLPPEAFMDPILQERARKRAEERTKAKDEDKDEDKDKA